MNGKNARKRMLNKIRTTIFRKQEKVAIQKANSILESRIKELGFWGRLGLIINGKF